MAITVPKFLGPDNVLRETFIFTTTQNNRFFSGVIDPNTADMEVSIRGAAFTSDPDVIFFEGTSFIVPNPSAYPEGLTLLAGSNQVDVRSISTTGEVSSSATIDANLIQEGDLGLLVTPPTGISVERKDGVVDVTVEGLDDPNVRGYNFYASTSPGGGQEGYSQINAYLIITGTTSESTSEIGTLNVDAVINSLPDGTPSADPLFVKILQTQEDQDDLILQTDFNEILEIPETVSRVRTTIVVESVVTSRKYTFTHDRDADFESTPPTIPNSDYTTIPAQDPLYYVVTAVFFDETRQLEIESSFSPEVVASPLIISAAVGTFPLTTRQQIIQDTSLSIFRSQPQVAIQSGSYTRDVFIDPFSSEAERLRFILDFVHRAQSFSTLLEIDDPSFSGESVPVNQSQYKLALKAAFFLVTDDEVQQIIDLSFESLASKYGVFRSAGKRSRGEVTYYTSKRPPASIPLPIGSVVLGGSTRFRTTQAAEITIENIASFFSATTGRYSVRVSVEAEEEGEVGNLAAGQISQTENAIAGLSVINEAPTFGGTGVQSNRDLAAEAQGVLSSVDSGTEQGYRKNIIDVPGVEQVRIVAAGDSLMQRDYDPVDQAHRLGKVDLWIKGENLATVTDDFAFTFEIAKDIQFVVVGDPNNLEFRAVDPKLTSANPIIQMLDHPTFGYELKNISTGHIFNLTNVEIISYNAIRLDSTYNDPASFTLTQVILGDYRYRTSDKYVLSRQPVREIESMTGSVTGEVDPDAFALYKLEDPLKKGRSTLAGDFLQLTDNQDPDVAIPSGDPVIVLDETHVILGQYTEYLDRLGINPLTIVVTSEDSLTTYVSPFDPAGSPDYTLIDGTSTTPIGIKRVETGNIVSGQTILVSYEHDENFQVAYLTNLLIKIAQEEIDTQRHITADVLVKEAIEVPVDLTATIVLESGVKPAQADSDVRTDLTNFFNSLVLGQPVRQSDIIDVIENAGGGGVVSYTEVPLTKMVRASDSQVIREVITTDQDSDVSLILQWSTSLNSVYLINDPLENATTDGGGLPSIFRGVFQDDDETNLVTATLALNGSPLNGAIGNSYIIGSEGISIPGYSDDVTLAALSPFISPTETQNFIVTTRKSLTANRVLVVLAGGVTQIQNEQHNLNNTDVTLLSNLKIFTTTLVVQNLAQTTTYTLGVDYTIVQGGSTIPVGLRRITTGGITNGQKVSIGYLYDSALVKDVPSNHDYTVTYVVGTDDLTRNINPGNATYLNLGDLDFTYDEDQDQ